MKLYRLPPAGNRILWALPPEERAVRALFAPWEIATFGSGTEALAAGLMTLKRKYRGRDEVILAAYNCPDLISAVLKADCVPRLVDLAPSRPWLDLEAVGRSLSCRTLAILAVDLFGIPERYAALNELATAGGCALVQDSAQGFPKRAGDSAWHGDLVVLSFGRGKPVTLLGGGAVLFRDRAFEPWLAQAFTHDNDADEISHARRVSLYHWLRSPRLFWIPAALPTLHLGETRYRPLSAVRPMPEFLRRRIPGAVTAYRAKGGGARARYALFDIERRFLDLPRACAVPADFPLSRYPLLAPDGHTRERICAALDAFGISRMYGNILPDIPGLGGVFKGQGHFPNAREFAQKLFTLPTHDGVSARDLSAIGKYLQSPWASSPAIREITG